MENIHSQLVSGLKDLLQVSDKEAMSLIKALPFSKYVEAYGAVKTQQMDKLSELFGIVTETPSINNVKPLANVTAGGPPPPLAPVPSTNPQMSPPQYKQGEKLTIGQANGEEMDADFSKLLPNGQIEVKMDNQIQKINPEDKNFTITQQTDMDEMTSAGCIASGGGPAVDHNPPHIYKRKTK